MSVCFFRGQRGIGACDTLFKYALCSWVRTEPIHSSIISPCVSVSAAGSYSLLDCTPLIISVSPARSLVKDAGEKRLAPRQYICFEIR
jgi:hypothetical protein